MKTRKAGRPSSVSEEERDCVDIAPDIDHFIDSFFFLPDMNENDQ